MIKFSRDTKIPSVGQELVETAREWAQTPSFGLSGHERLNILRLTEIDNALAKHIRKYLGSQ